MINITFEEDSFCTKDLLENVCKVELEYEKENFKKNKLIKPSSQNQFRLSDIDLDSIHYDDTAGVKRLTRVLSPKNSTPIISKVSDRLGVGENREIKKLNVTRIKTTSSSAAASRFSKRLANKQKLGNLSTCLDRVNQSIRCMQQDTINICKRTSTDETCSDNVFPSFNGDHEEINSGLKSKPSPNTKLTQTHNKKPCHKFETGDIESCNAETKNSKIYVRNDKNFKDERNESQHIDELVLHEPQVKQRWNSVDTSSFLSSQDRLELSSWGLPGDVLKKYEENGISKMFPWQAECLSLPGVLEGQNLVYSAPTSAGKTLVAEIVLLKRVLEQGKKGIFILPFVSVAREKTFCLQRMFGVMGVRVEGFMGGQSPPGGFQKTDIAICTIEKANNIINRLIEDQKVDELGIIVVDELHMVGDSQRGYLLELLLTKLQYISAVNKKSLEIQVIGMSATLPNLHILAQWQKAKLYSTSFRPIPLLQMVKIGPVLYKDDFTVIRDLSSVEFNIKDDRDHLIQLCLETVLEGFSLLMFCPTKAWCEKIALSVASSFFSIGRENSEYPEKVVHLLRSRLDGEALCRVIEALRGCPAGLDPVLQRSLAFGAAFHHAGLTFDERDIIEGAFRAGYVPVLVATSTLSSGVNLPARRVIIRSPNSGGRIMDPLVYRQMVGRAGRKGKDTQGESILMCATNEKHKAEHLVTSSLAPITSCLQRHSSLTTSMKRAVLEIVVSGAAKTAEDIKLYWDCTLLAASTKDVEEKSESSENTPKPAIEESMRYLLDNELARYQEINGETSFVGTQLGTAILASGLSPDEGLHVFSELQRARQCFVLENELHVVYQVTPVYVSDAWPNLDWLHFLELWENLPAAMKKVGELVGIEESFIVRAMKGAVNYKIPKQRSLLAIHQRFYASLALHDLVHEVTLNAVVSKYGATKGLLQALQQSAATFAGMVTIFCNRLGWHNLELLIAQYQNRLQFGIQRDLCDIVRISLLNGRRARLLFDAGLETVGQIAHSNRETIENILLNSGPFQSRKGVNGNLGFILGPNGCPLSIAEAAKSIVNEARILVQKELCLDYIDWDQKASNKVPAPSIEVDRNTASIIPRPPSSLLPNMSGNSKEDSRLNLNFTTNDKKSPLNCKRVASADPENKRKSKSPKLMNEERIPKGDESSLGRKGTEGGSVGKVEIKEEKEKLPVKEIGEGRGRNCSSNIAIVPVSLSNQSLNPSKDHGTIISLLKSNATEVSTHNDDPVLKGSFDHSSNPVSSSLCHGDVKCTTKSSSKPSCSTTLKPKNKIKGSFLFAQPKMEQKVTEEKSHSVYIPESQESPTGKENVSVRTKSKNRIKKGPTKEVDGNQNQEKTGEINPKTTKTINPQPINSETVKITKSRKVDSEITNPVQREVSSSYSWSESLKAALLEMTFDDSRYTFKKERDRTSAQSEDFFNLSSDEEFKTEGEENELRRKEINELPTKSEPKTPYYSASSEEVDFGFDLSGTEEPNVERRKRNLPRQNESYSTNNATEKGIIDYDNVNDISSFCDIASSSHHDVNESTIDFNDESVVMTESGALSMTRESIEKDIHEFESSVLEKSGHRSFLNNTVSDSVLNRAFETHFLSGENDKGKGIECGNGENADQNIGLVPSSKGSSSGKRPSKDLSPSPFDDFSSIVLTPGIDAILRGKTTPYQVVEYEMEKSFEGDLETRKPRNAKREVVKSNNFGRKGSKTIPKLQISSSEKAESDLDQTVNLFKDLQSSFDHSMLQSTRSLRIIDVTSDKRLFDVFIEEWKSKEKFALCLTLEKAPTQPSKGGIGWRFCGRSRRTFSQRQPVAGLVIEQTKLLLTGMAVSWGHTDAYYINLKNNKDVDSANDSVRDTCFPTPPINKEVSLQQRVTAIKDVLGNDIRERTILMWQVKETLKLLYRSGIGISQANFQDPRIAAWLLDPTAKEKNLHNMVMTYIEDHLHLLENVGSTVGMESIGICDPGRVSKGSPRVRSATESVLVFHLTQAMVQILDKERLRKALELIEMPSIYNLSLMELNGMGFCQSECQEQKILMQEKLDLLEAEAFRMVGHPFSIASPDEVAKILYSELRLEPITDRCTKIVAIRGRGATSKRGRLVGGSTNKETLEKLEDQHPLPKVILEWRKIKSALTKVVYPLSQDTVVSVHLGEERIFPVCHTFTATGRVTFHEPNVQNIPKDFSIELPPRRLTLKTKGGKGGKDCNIPIMRQLAPLLDPLDHCSSYAVSLRNIIVAGKGRVLLAADYSQLELRILAHLSGDEKLLKALNGGEDVFRSIASQIYSLPLSEITSNMRQEAKQVCYGIIYGMSEKTLGDQLGLNQEAAEDFMAKFHQRFPSIQKFIKRSVEEAKESGFVLTMEGRRRFLPGLVSPSIATKGQSERQAVNTRIQGSAADLVKKALVAIQEKQRENFPFSPPTLTQPLQHDQTLSGAYLVLQLHDELIYEVANDDVIQVAQIVKHHMENVCALSVRLPVKIKVGPTWGTVQTLNL